MRRPSIVREPAPGRKGAPGRGVYPAAPVAPGVPAIVRRRRPGSRLRALPLGVGLLALASARAGAVDFQPRGVLAQGLGFAIGLAIGPEDPDPSTRGDGCLYVLDGQGGAVHRLCFDAAKQVTERRVVLDLRGDEPIEHGVGIALEPPRASAPDEIALYLSYSTGPGAPFDGYIARAVSRDGGTSFAVDERFVTGLPRSAYNHQTNGLAFGPDGCLYVGQGGNSNVGYDADHAESRLSGAILRACFRGAAGAPRADFDGDCGAGGVQRSCDVEVFASGVYNPFDLLWHTNGSLYATDNDVNPGFRDACENVANDFGCPCQRAPGIVPTGNELNRIERGATYGFPNPYRAHPAARQCQGGASAGDACADDDGCPGGTCASLAALCTDEACGSPEQCFYFGEHDPPQPGEDPRGRYRAPLAQPAALLEGLAEYAPPRRDAASRGGFCSEMHGELVSGTGPDAPWRLALSPDGRRVTEAAPLDVALSGYDVAVGDDGTLYAVATLGGRVTYARPVELGEPGAPGFFRSCDLTSATATVTAGGAAKRLPVAMQDLAAGRVSIEGRPRLLVLGAAGTDAAFLLDPDAGSWSAAPPIPGDTHDHRAAATVDDALYLMGGLRPLTADVWRHDGRGAPQPRTPVGCASRDCERGLAVGASAAATLDGAIYLVGGLCDAESDPGCTCRAEGCARGNTDRAFRYDPGGDAWTELAPMPVALDHVAATALAGELHLFGGRGCGRNQACPARATVQIYDPRTDRWRLGPDMPEPCAGGGAAVVLDGRAYVIGGEGQGCSGTAIFEYDPGRERWRKAGELPVERHGIWPVAFGTAPDGVPARILVAGGDLTPRALDTISFPCEECVAEGWPPLTSR